MTLSKQYARAIFDVRAASDADDKTLAVRVIEALKRRHHDKLLPIIFREYEKIVHEEEKRGITIRVASEKEKPGARAVLKDMGQEAKEPRTVVDPTLVKGFVIHGKDFRYDKSAKRTLIELYKKLITA